MNNVQEENEHRSERPSTVVRRQELGERLVALAATAIAAEGVQELRARALADAAGCSVGAIYGVFPDLDELVLTVNARTLDGIDAAMQAAAEGDAAPAPQLARLAAAYLDYAVAHPRLWQALFLHQMARGRAVPGWYLERLRVAFTPVEAPLAMLRPDLAPGARTLLARTLFSAVHGMVALGLDSKVTTAPLPVLRVQVQTVVAAMARGLQS